MRIVISSLVAAILLMQAHEMVSAQTPPLQSNGAIHFQPPPAPKPAPTIQLAAPPAPASAPAALDLIVRTASQAAPIPKIQGPVSVQGPASAAAAAVPFIAGLPIRPVNPLGFAPQRPPGPPPAEIRELATLSEPPIPNAPPPRSAEAAPIGPLSSTAQFTLTEPPASFSMAPPAADTAFNVGNAAGIALGALALIVALGSVVVSRRVRA